MGPLEDMDPLLDTSKEEEEEGTSSMVTGEDGEAEEAIAAEEEGETGTEIEEDRSRSSRRQIQVSMKSCVMITSSHCCTYRGS